MSHSTSVSNSIPVRELANDSLSRYSLTWQLQTDGNIHVTMEMDWNGFQSAAFKSIGKGSLKDYTNVTVTQIHPQDSRPIILQHQVYERNGYVFCKWFAANDTPDEESLQFIIDYGIMNGIQKGCIRASCNDDYCTSDESETMMQEYCTQSFHPETVNEFKIPVQNVSYNFTLPNDQNAFIPKSLTFMEYPGLGGNSGYADGCNWNRMDSYMYVNCDALISDKSTSPQRPTFTWYVTDIQNEVPSCKIPCSKNNSKLWIGIGAGVASAWILGLLYLWKRKRNMAQHESIQNVYETPFPSAPLQTGTESDTLSMEQVTSLVPLVQHQTAYKNLSQIISRHNKLLKASGKYEHATTPNVFSCETCSICLLDFRSKDMVRLLPRCAHLFHTKCIDPWLSCERNCCPSCNEIVLKKL